MLKKFSALFIILFIVAIEAQEKENGFSSYLKNFKLSGYTQIWLRHTELNPGSVDDNNNLISSINDVSMRRIRLGFSGYPVDKLFVKLNFGENNWNRTSNFIFRFLTGYVAYFKSEKLRIGFGRSLNQGLSRFAGPGSSSQLGSDIIVAQLPTINRYDKIARRTSLFIKGNLGQFEYRTSIAKPFLYDNSTYQISQNYNFSGNGSDLIYSGYFKYQFAETESTISDTGVGTYFGKKKIIALGAGFMYHNKSLWRLNSQNNIEYSNMLHLALDLFVDIPLNNNRQSFTGYLGLFDMNYGENYIRNIGPNSPVSEGASIFPNGLGSGYAMLGTGRMIFFTSAYKFKFSKTSKNNTIPYFNVHFGDYDLLKDNVFWFDVGLEYYLSKGNSLAFGYRNRPFFELNGNNDYVVTNRFAEFVLQYQIKF